MTNNSCGKNKSPVWAGVREKNINSYSHYNIVGRVKEIPIGEIFQRYIGYELKWQGKRLVARCPFHGGVEGDKHPSLYLYPDSNRWWCFGCSNGGDSISVVMLKLNIGFKEAIKTISTDFNIPILNITSDEIAVARLQANNTRKKREYEQRFKAIEITTYQRLASLYRAIDYELSSIKTQEDLDRCGDFFHISVILEYLLEVLRCGSPEDRIAVLKDERVRWWCGW